MARRIAIVLGHPDPAPGHFGPALSAAYGEAARAAGHEVQVIDVARLDFPLLRSQAEFEAQPAPAPLQPAQATIAWCDRVVLFFPLWLGTMPALLKGFLEQVLRPGFAFRVEPGGRWLPALKGKSARVVVTMGMPAFWYRLYYRAHGVRGLERNVLEFCGIAPVRRSLVGGVAALSESSRRRWLARFAELGRRAE